VNETPTAKAPQSLIVGLARLVVSMLVFGAVLFLLAGTMAWPAGWAYLAVNVVILAAYSVILIRLHPDLVDERKTPPADAKAWDKPYVALVGALGPFLLVATCGLDHRMRWSAAVPDPLVIVGFVLMAGGGAFTNYAVAHNRFFSAIVRIQRDRGHRVVDTGPYEILRHPGYVGSILHMAGTSLALGSWWALVVAGFLSAVITVRTAREDLTLREELEGYEDYVAHVRYRLFPWVW
jgi:protein-S-isoprenylcysteine O-methyltransferase Ste14